MLSFSENKGKASASGKSSKKRDEKHADKISGNNLDWASSSSAVGGAAWVDESTDRLLRVNIEDKSRLRKLKA